MTGIDLFPAILFAPQFSRDDVLAVTGITSGVLKGILDRKQVTLQGDHNPGTGRRRMYTGGDILKIATADAGNAIGFPLRFAYLLADSVFRRASGRLTGTALEPCTHFAMAFYPNATGDDCAFVPVFDGKPASALPVGYQFLDCDRLIDETVAKLTALINDEMLPNFSIPEIKPFDIKDIFEWQDKDRKLLVGLSADETAEYFQLSDLYLAQRSQSEENWQELITPEQRERQESLDDRYRTAVLRRDFLRRDGESK